ncbi:hypothetical protein BMETH_2510_0 [methanotrophic bacterial endosymbiont of Bathymodiolus sp.]|nr:hypothetical protein BMETH_2510_0 [methanotrophic bacterial endosymbiont of Bathymodiolus sp.]
MLCPAFGVSIKSAQINNYLRCTFGESQCCALGIGYTAFSTLTDWVERYKFDYFIVIQSLWVF